MRNISPQTSTPTVSRRWLLKAAPTAAAGLMLYSCAPETAASYAAQKLNPFIEFTADGRVVLTCPEAEMGQDVFSGLTKILADEIGLDWASVDVVRAPHSKDYYGKNGGQNTGGSQSMRRWYQPLRDMGARIRMAFANAAAQEFDVAASEIVIEQSLASHSATNQSLPLHALLETVASSALPETAPLKADRDLKLIGKDFGRKDIPAKITGNAQYGADVRLPGMLYAAVQMLPVRQGDADVEGIEAARAMPGVKGVDVMGNGVAVVASTWWAANEAAKTLQLTAKTPTTASQLDMAAISKTLDAAMSTIDQPALPQSDLTHSAAYDVPFLSHICMETMTATVAIEDGKARVWTSTQAVSRFAQRVATTLDIPLANVTLENMFLGGGFGRKGTDMQALDLAVSLAKQYAKPVQVTMDRPNDIRSDQFRPAAKFAFSAQLGGDKEIANLQSATATQSLLKDRLPRFYKAGRPEFPEGGMFRYSSAKADHGWAEAELPVPIGFWRSVGGSSFPFASESFVEELAYLAGEDPIAYRLKLLEDHPRLRTVLETASKMAGWTGAKGTAGTGYGVGLFEGWGSVCAQIAQVTVANNTMTVDKVWAAVDCGRAISPDTVRAQVVSGIHCGLSAALFGQVTFVDGQAEEENFDGYQVIAMHQSPDIDVKLVPSDNPPGGVGEIGTPPTAPAVANALFAASGKRVRSLPLKNSIDI